MKRKIIIFAVMSAFALSACSTGGVSDTKKTEAVVSEAMEEGTSAVAENMDFNEILGLLGKEDEDIVAAMGEGITTINEEKILTEREYELAMFGEVTHTSMEFNLYKYGDSILEMCTIRLNKKELDGYRGELTRLLGEPSQTNEDSYFYETDQATVVLASPDDQAYVEITLKQDIE